MHQQEKQPSSITNDTSNNNNLESNKESKIKEYDSYKHFKKMDTRNLVFLDYSFFIPKLNLVNYCIIIYVIETFETFNMYLMFWNLKIRLNTHEIYILKLQGFRLCKFISAHKTY